MKKLWCCELIAVLLATVQMWGAADFFTVPSYPVATGPEQIASGDFNGDGITDVATAEASTVSVLLGAKNGSLGNLGSYPISAGPTGLAVGDLNHDGLQDLVVLIGTGSVGMTCC